MSTVSSPSAWRPRPSSLALLVISAVVLYVVISLRQPQLSAISVVFRNPPLTKQYVTVPTTTIVSTDKRKVRILYWTAIWGRSDWGYSAALLRKCPHLRDKCEFTANHSQYETSDALLFHMRDSLNLPSHRRRPPQQKWIFAIMESPYHTHVNLDTIQGLFNTSMTYRQNSDIDWSYGGYRNASRSKFDAARNYAKGKTKMAAWFVSHCLRPSKREVYAKELQKHIDVHVYGKCGPYKCQRAQSHRCFKDMAKQYKFYLSFENSLCTDYITEKLWHALTVNVVPVVLGGANYSALLPPHSYIDVKEYASPKALAKYLQILDKNDALYNRYFEWKNTLVVYLNDQLPEPSSCSVCQHIYEQQNIRETLTDVKSYWSIPDNCIEPQSYYHGIVF